MRKIFTLLFFTTLFFNCSSDDSNDVLTDGDGITDENNALLTISRGSGFIPFFGAVDIRDFTVEAIVTGDDGTILARSFLEFDSEIKLEAEYDKNKTYDLHFVERFFDSNKTTPEFSYENVLTYNVITILGATNRLYAYDGISYDDSVTITRPPEKTGYVKLQFNNIPYNLGLFGYSTNGSSFRGDGSLSSTKDFDINVEPKSTNTVYSFIGSEDENGGDVRFIKEDLTDGESLVFDFDEMSITTPIDIDFSVMNTQNMFVSSKNFYEIFAFDTPSDKKTLLSSSLFKRSNLFSTERTFFPNDAFQKYSIYSSIFYDEFTVLTKRVYDNINEIPKKYTHTGLNAKIINNSFPDIKAEAVGEYDYFIVKSSYNDGENFSSDTKRFAWTIYGDANSEISIDQKNLFSNLFQEKDNFEVPMSDLKNNLELSLISSDVIDNYNDYISDIINRNISIDNGYQNFERWSSRSINSINIDAINNSQ
ncbi:hypothetical protein [Aquimarina algicola]|uniref:Uncharacterized protein n=1 Tax=Aquimarina algicola TaxID=2589995 RepID=A0A504JPP2_9FLAO|nr:hypothetical protein [Aquimarina algicola]TPN88721.1 hypothetical protein FHK87_00465 [Aquimarina algicola]